MAEPEFDPNKPFDVVSDKKVPEFDPNQKFEVVKGGAPIQADFRPDQPFEVKKSAPPSVLESILRGLAQGASLGYADEAIGGVKSLLGPRSYQEYRDEQRVADENARGTNPKSFIASEFAGGVATPIAAARALKVLGLASNAANASKYLDFAKRAGSGAIQTGLTDYGQSKGEFDPKETASALGSGAAMSFAPEAIKGAVKALSYPARGVMSALGYTGQLPQRAIEASAKWLGGKTPPEMIEKTSYRETGSKLTKEYGEAMRRRALSDKDDIIKKMSFNPTHMSYDDLNPDQREELAGVLQSLIKNRGRESYEVPKNLIAQQLESQLGVSEELRKTPVIDLMQARMRMTPKTAYEYAATANKTVPIGNVNNEAALTSRDSILRTLDQHNRGNINQNFEDVAQYGEGMKKAGFGNIVMDLENKYKAAPNPREQVLMREIEEKGSIAREALKNINIGRDKIKDAMPLFGVSGTILSGSDSLGSMGQFASRMSKKMTPEGAAKSIVANPSILQALAGRGGELGKMSQELLDSTNAAGMTGLKSKAFVMSMHPKFRALFSDDKANQDLQSQE